jgi:PAS domain S-box-containing protein
MRKVFIVEDDKFITAIFTMFLRDLGHELVGQTSSGKEAIGLCVEMKPDVVLMDIHLEGDLDGIQTAEMLKRELEIPVIYISSDTSSQVIERAIVSNSYGYLVKPINKKELGISIDLAYYKHKVDLDQKYREQSYREFISDSPLPIVVVRNGKIMYLNRLGSDVFRTHYIEDVLGLPIENFVHEKYRDQFMEAIHCFDGDKRIKPFMAKMKTVHGDLYWSEITGSSVNFNNHKSVQLILKDVSDCKLMEKKVRVYEKVLFGTKKAGFILNNKFQILKISADVPEVLKGEVVLGNLFGDLLLDENIFLEHVKKANAHSYEPDEIEIEFKNGIKMVFNLLIIWSIDGEIIEVVLTEKCNW